MREIQINRLYNVLGNLSKFQGYNYLSTLTPNNFNCGIYFFFDKISPIENESFKITYIGITKDNNNNRLEKHKINGPSSFRDHVEVALKNKYIIIQNSNSINDYIHNLPYLFVTIKDIAQLREIEKRIIELVSNYKQNPPIHVPNKNWLGYNADNIISQAHIWNIQNAKNFNKLNDYNGLLDMLESYINEMICLKK